MKSYWNDITGRKTRTSCVLGSVYHTADFAEKSKPWASAINVKAMNSLPCAKSVKC